MKNFLLILLLLPFTVFGQKETLSMPINQNGVIEFTEVVAVDSADAKDLYSRARLFVAKAFVSATDVTKLEDVETKTIITKGLLPRNYTYPFNKDFGGNVRFTFTIQCREGRYKYSVTDFVHEDRLKSGSSGGALENAKPACGGLYMTKSMWLKIKSETNGHISGFVEELKKTMSGSVAFSGKEDW